MENLSSTYAGRSKEWIFWVFGVLSLAFFIGLLASRFLVSVSTIGFLVLGAWEASRSYTWATYWAKIRAQSFYTGTMSLFFITFLSGIYTQDWGEYWERVRIAIPLLSTPLAFAAIPSFGQEKIRIIWAFFVGTIAVALVIVLIHYYLNYNEIIELLAQSKSIPCPQKDHIRFSLLVCIAACVSGRYFWAYWQENRLRLAAYFGILGIFLSIGLHILAVRSGLLGFYLVIGTNFAIWVWSGRRYLLGIVGIFGLTALPLLAYLYVPSIRSKVALTLHNIELVQKGEIGDYSDTQRLLSYQIAWGIIREQPIFGVGMGDLKGEMEKVYTRDYPTLKKMFPHNQFITYWAGTGLVGLLVFLIGFFAPLFKERAYRLAGFMIFYPVMASSFLTENTLIISIGVGIYTYFLLLNVKELEQENAKTVSASI